MKNEVGLFVMVAMVGLFCGFLIGFSTLKVNTDDVVNSKEITIGNSIYQCKKIKEIRAVKI